MAPVPLSNIERYVLRPVFQHKECLYTGIATKKSVPLVPRGAFVIWHRTRRSRILALRFQPRADRCDKVLQVPLVTWFVAVPKDQVPGGQECVTVVYLSWQCGC